MDHLLQPCSQTVFMHTADLKYFLRCAFYTLPKQRAKQLAHNGKEPLKETDTGIHSKQPTNPCRHTRSETMMQKEIKGRDNQ